MALLPIVPNLNSDFFASRLFVYLAIHTRLIFVRTSPLRIEKE